MAARRIHGASGRCFALLAIVASCAALGHLIALGFVAPQRPVISVETSPSSCSALRGSLQGGAPAAPEETSVFGAVRSAARALGGALLVCAVLLGAGSAPGGTSFSSPSQAVAATSTVEKKSSVATTPGVERKSTDVLFTNAAQKKFAESKAAKTAEAEAVKAADVAAKKFAAAADAIKKVEAEIANIEKALKAPKVTDKAEKIAALKTAQSKRADLLKEQNKLDTLSGSASRKATAAKRATAEFEKKVEDIKKETKNRLERLATTKATFLKRAEEFKAQDTAAQTAVTTAKDKLKVAQKAKIEKDIKKAQADLQSAESNKVSAAAKYKAAQATLDEQLLDEKDLNSLLGPRVAAGAKQCFLGVFC